LVNFTSFSLSESDHIKQLPLFFKLAEINEATSIPLLGSTLKNATGSQRGGRCSKIICF
jgi:hypothetical protein